MQQGSIAHSVVDKGLRWQARGRLLPTHRRCEYWGDVVPQLHLAEHLAPAAVRIRRPLENAAGPSDSPRDRSQGPHHRSTASIDRVRIRGVRLGIAQ